MSTLNNAYHNQYTDKEHPFAQYTRILGKGKQGTRSLDENEAYTAFTMILNGDVLPEQLGAFMMLLRVKEESVDELVGFVKAVKNHIQYAHGKEVIDSIKPDLDWQSYAGKKKHHAWYLLSALTLAKHGIKVCMHGAKGHTIGRVYSEDLLAAIGQPISASIADINEQLTRHNFCYVPLEILEPTLNDIINMRNIFGLRSPVHSLSRLINPFDAPATIQSIFHPSYQPSHLQSGKNLGYLNSMVIKGDGGEFERNPDARSKIMGLKNGVEFETRLPMLNDRKSPIETDFSPELLLAVWQGSQKPHYAMQAIIETLALALMTLNKVEDYKQGTQLAQQMWTSRFE